MSLSHGQVKRRFATRRRYMIGDLSRGVRAARANYLVALGALTYIEAAGALITGSAGLLNQSRSNFNAALNHMPAAYSAFQVKIHRPGMPSGSGAYEILRCGMVHQYEPGGEFMVENRPRGRARRGRIGFEWDVLPSGSQQLVLNTNELVRDLKDLLDKISGWIRTKNRTRYPLIKQGFERIDSFRVAP